MFRLTPILPADISIGEEWTDADIARRCDLVEKDVKGIITPAESIDLESLTQKLRKLRRLHTAIVFDETRTILEELERKATEAKL